MVTSGGMWWSFVSTISVGRMTARAAIYLRILLDAAMDGLAIDRQREDCGAIAKQRGWTVVHTYVYLLVLRFLKEKYAQSNRA